MVSKYKLVVTSSGINSTTGHHIIQCRIEETTEDGSVIRGVPETYGIDSRSMATKHNGDTVAWRNWVAGRMLNAHRQRSLAHAEIVLWHGKEFDIADPV